MDRPQSNLAKSHEERVSWYRERLGVGESEGGLDGWQSAVLLNREAGVDGEGQARRLSTDGLELWTRIRHWQQSILTGVYSSLVNIGIQVWISVVL